MPEAVYQVMTALCALVAPLPIGTNLGLLHLLWMLVRVLLHRSGQPRSQPQSPRIERLVAPGLPRTYSRPASAESTALAQVSVCPLQCNRTRGRRCQNSPST